MSNREANLDAMFDALSNQNRRGMIHTLAFRPASLSQLADEFNISLPAVNKHIGILQRANLIQRRKVGRTNYVALNQESLQIAQVWLGKYQTHWGNQQQSLENYLERLDN